MAFLTLALMENQQNEIIGQMTLLLEKMAVASFAPVVAEAAPDEKLSEAVLINLKSLNAKYDKHEAIEHVRALMDKYNIQIDELLELIKH